MFYGQGQGTVKRVLFLGNSYTYVNNLPLLVAALASSAGDSLVAEFYCPGGYTLGWNPIAHATDPVSLGLIAAGNREVVVLQEQSQTPSIPVLRDSCMGPGGQILADAVRQYNGCSQVMYYLTWGRRFGGMQCFTPNYCSASFTGFDQMQDSVTRSYKLVADSTGGVIAPVGEAWRFVLHHSGMVLHDGDNSHPNLNGSYLAACVFYSSIYHRKSAGLAFTAGLAPDSALFLQQAADSVVFGYQQSWNLWQDEPHAAFDFNIGHDTLYTHNLSENSIFWHWDFGDGATSSEFEPVHQYQVPGIYAVRLRSCDSCRCDSVSKVVQVVISGIHPSQTESGFRVVVTGEMFRFNHLTGNGIIQLFDVTGRLVFSAKFDPGMTLHTLLSPGIYNCVIQRVGFSTNVRKVIVTN
jgi:hypothetical protein